MSSSKHLPQQVKNNNTTRVCKHPHSHPTIEIGTTTTPQPTTVVADKPVVGFASCGLDRSCPTSVTTPQGQGVRLDQYQSSSIREKRTKRPRRTIVDGCDESAVANTTNPRYFFTISDPSTYTMDHNSVVVPDHEFEWYDLDAIREVDSAGNTSNDDCAIIIGHDFHAGLVFTTERQVLNQGVKVNIVNPSVGTHDINNRQESEFDLFSWVNNSTPNEVRETPDEREFRERMEELEQEVNSDYLSSSSSSSLYLSLSSSFSFSNHNENDRDGDSSFSASWHFEE